MKKTIFLVCASLFMVNLIIAQSDNKRPAPQQQEEELFKVVEQMPQFPGCSDILDKSERGKCAQENMLQYLYKNLSYPKVARDNKTEGMVVVQFVVRKNGDITDVEIVREIGDGCGQAAASVVESMNNMAEKWTPGMQRSVPVSVLYTLPVRFKLEGKSSMTKASLIKSMNEDENEDENQNKLTESDLHYFEGTVMVDGQISSTKVLKTISPELIEEINIIKGEEAKKLYNLTHNAGIIIITTKK